MSKSLISLEELRRLRNDVPLKEVIDELGLETASRGERRTFRCPECNTFHTAVRERTNLARCFRCGQNYNSIDLVMAARGSTFLDAVRFLGAIAAVERPRPTALRSQKTTKTKGARVVTATECNSERKEVRS